MDITFRRGLGPVTSGRLGSLSQESVAPATIINLDTNETVQCTFRPKEYTFQKQNSWTPGKVSGTTMQPPKFGGGQPMTMTMELMFDTNEAPGTQDVRDVTDALWRMMKISPSRTDGDTNKGEPPHVEFRWGKSWSFQAVIQSLSQRFTLFKGDGTPVRSVINVTFLQATEQGKYPGQNPTSGGREGYSVHVVKEGETIDWIAFKEYGDSNAWRHLADANNLEDPMRLLPGQRLLLAPLRT